jgi:hypothetical protein
MYASPINYSRWRIEEADFYRQQTFNASFLSNGLRQKKISELRLEFNAQIVPAQDWAALNFAGSALTKMKLRIGACKKHI